MGRPLRLQQEDFIYFVTNRCFQEMCVLQPDSPEVERICVGTLVRFAKRYGIDVMAYVFMGNHFHLLLRAIQLNLHVFMKDFQANLTKRINAHRGRTGTLFPQRYASSPVLDEAALEQVFFYILMNPVKAGLVEHPSLWPGGISFGAHTDGGLVEASWVDCDRLRFLKRKAAAGSLGIDDEALMAQASVNASLELAPLPHWVGGDDVALRQRIVEHVGHACEAVEQERHVDGDVHADLDDGIERESDEEKRGVQRRRSCVKGASRVRVKRVRKGFLGVEGVRKLSWRYRPKNPKRSKLPLCHATCPVRRRAFVLTYRTACQNYREACGRMHLSRKSWRFPPGMIPPVIQRLDSG